MDKCIIKVLFHTKMMVSFNKVNSAKPNPSATKTSLCCCRCENKCCPGYVNKQHVQGLRSEKLTNENHKKLTSLLFHTVRIIAGDKLIRKFLCLVFTNHITFQKQPIGYWLLKAQSLFYLWTSTIRGLRGVGLSSSPSSETLTSLWPFLPLLQYPAVRIAT